MYVCVCVFVCVSVCVCVNATCILSLKLCTFCDVKCVDLRKNMLFGEKSLEKAESLYAYYNAMLIQTINVLDMCERACVRVCECERVCKYMNDCHVLILIGLLCSLFW